MQKGIIVPIVLLVFSISSQAQSPEEMMKERQEKYAAELKEYNKGTVDTSRRFFYKTYEDYVKGIPVTETKYTGKRKILMDTESVLISENNDFVYKKIKELKYWGFIDEWGQLERIFSNHCYYVLDTGKICTYLKAMDVEMITDKAGKITLNWLSDNMSATKDYLSDGPTGSIEAFNEKKFQSRISDYPGLYEEYKKEPVNTKVKDVRTERAFKLKKYVDRYNTGK